MLADSPVASCQRVYLLASSLSQGWGIREADGGLGLVDAQVAEPPDVPRVLGVQPARTRAPRCGGARRDQRAPAAPLPAGRGRSTVLRASPAGRMRPRRPGLRRAGGLPGAAVSRPAHRRGTAGRTASPAGARRAAAAGRCAPGRDPGFRRRPRTRRYRDARCPSTGCRGHSRTPTCHGSTRSSSRSGRPAAGRPAAAARHLRQSSRAGRPARCHWRRCRWHIPWPIAP